MAKVNEEEEEIPEEMTEIETTVNNEEEAEETNWKEFDNLDSKDI